ncbi:hypothetical protein Val02_18090 [Virgisporangium aliadipatigenens]|uniref:NACHT domain-containing protein n=1 Tax=Virgisporangium aliadipatigenens TaxID=741659 RepID=A0A8J4DPR1_9ACTN|nr:hypothetical protein [Virgisporangium aliadipatigenens]GIJ44923.1 hypothetical protein Val02_18090 [Virgisporangium aliadipatigenens]
MSSVVRRPLLWWISGCALLSGAGLLWFGWWIAPRTDVVGLVSTIAGVTGVLVALLSLAVALNPPGAVDPGSALDSAAAVLRTRVRRQWDGDRWLPGLRDDVPLKVLWTGVERDVASRTSQRIPGGGTVDDLAAAYRGLAPRQLVIIGEPATGKTVMAVLLLLRLLDDERVPALFPLSSWNPLRDPLRDWLAACLAQDHPWLARAEYGSDAAAALVANDRVLPVLDGLDEMAPDLRAAAVRRLAEAEGMPFVLTSRPVDYREALRVGGRALGRAAVVALEPVAPADAVAFLRGGELLDLPSRWNDVADAAGEPGRPLTRVLTRPLAVYLTQVACRQAEPAAVAAIGDESTLERTLHECYVPALYHDRPDPARVERHLAVLARHNPAGADIPWWRPIAPPPVLRGLTRAAVGLALLLLLGVDYGPAIGGVVAILLGPRVGTMLLDGTPPRRMRWWHRHLLLALAVGALVALAFVALVRLAGPAERATVFGALSLATLAVVYVATAMASRALDSTDPVQPRALLAGDRAALLAAVGAVAGAAGLRATLQSDLGHGLLSAAQSAVFVGLGVVIGLRLGSAWLSLGVVRLWLALRWGLPWRLLAFLDDAHRRGVLRRSGASYRFRHAEIQEYLAGRLDRSR